MVDYHCRSSEAIDRLYIDDGTAAISDDVLGIRNEALTASAPASSPP